MPTCVGNCAAACSYSSRAYCRCRGDRFPGPGRTRRRHDCRRPRRPARTGPPLRSGCRPAPRWSPHAGTGIRPFARRRRKLVERVERFLQPAVVAQRLGLGQRDLISRVTGPLGRLVRGQRFVILVERQIGFAQIEMRECPAVAVREHLDRVAIAAQQVKADTQPGRRRRAAARLLFELGRRVAQLAVVSIALADRGRDLRNLIRPKPRR